MVDCTGRSMVRQDNSSLIIPCQPQSNSICSRFYSTKHQPIEQIMWHLYLDESGDLGFDFDSKKPSEFLTITILATNDSDTAKALNSAVKHTLRRKVNRRKKHIVHELKGSNSSIAVKRFFYEKISSLNFGIYAMTLNKKEVDEELRNNAITKSRLYNFIAQQILRNIPFEEARNAVELIVDKSKKKREMEEFNEYVFSQLKTRIDPRVQLTIHHRDSCAVRNLSAVDLFSWGIFRRYERNDREWHDCYRDKILFDGYYP
ncbi:MAG: DUF3800 domain-containing protein [Pirellulales bacterium]|nr:DUF3800 domain-containing protein [Pirellulales bacterium]